VNGPSRPGGRGRPVSLVRRALSRSFSSASGDGTDQSASGGSTSARAAGRCTRSMAGNRDVAVTRSRSPGACGPSATRRSGSASTTREAFRASGNRGFGASGPATHVARRTRFSGPAACLVPEGRDARCRRLERGRAASLCNLRRVQGPREAVSETQEDWVWTARHAGVELSQIAVSLRPF
jgi:hypothetical protein